MPQIIGICGFIGAGKDTVADYLVNIHGFRRESFASSLKDAVSVVFGWNRELLEGRSKQGREWREQPDAWWSNKLGKTITPRYILQHWGTDVIRNGFHDDIWLASLENRLRSAQDDVVVTDCRFPNEIASIRDAGGMILQIQRGPMPEWYTCAHKENNTWFTLSRSVQLFTLTSTQIGPGVVTRMLWVVSPVLHTKCGVAPVGMLARARNVMVSPKQMLESGTMVVLSAGFTVIFTVSRELHPATEVTKMYCVVPSVVPVVMVRVVAPVLQA